MSYLGIVLYRHPAAVAWQVRKRRFRPKPYAKLKANNALLAQVAGIGSKYLFFAVAARLAGPPQPLQPPVEALKSHPSSTERMPLCDGLPLRF
jgi:hypothetical protein